MAELTDEAKQQIELEVRRLLDEGDLRRQSEAAEQLNQHRDFLVKNTRWVITGFLGLLAIFGTLATFLIGAQLDYSIIDTYLSKRMSGTMDSQIDVLTEDKIEEAKLEIGNFTEEAVNSSKNEVSNAVEQRTQEILNETVGDKIEEVTKSFTASGSQNILESVLATGAIMAFDRPNGCPPGWSFYRPAGGRTILGAGQHRNVDQNGQWLKVYPSYADNPEGAIGGEEAHTLTANELASHSHTLNYVPEMSDLSGNGFPVMSDTRHPSAGSVVRSETTQASGGNVAHNNMPPYIALYFCKYEGTG